MGIPFVDGNPESVGNCQKYLEFQKSEKFFVGLSLSHARQNGLCGVFGFQGSDGSAEELSLLENVGFEQQFFFPRAR